jgi:hypothetical protein
MLEVVVTPLISFSDSYRIAKEIIDINLLQNSFWQIRL